MSDFDKILKNKLENFREFPSSEVFNNIRKNYPKRSFSEFVRYNKYYFIAAITTVLLTAVIIAISVKAPDKNSQIVLDNTINNTEIVNSDNLNNSGENNLNKKNNDVYNLNADNEILVSENNSNLKDGQKEQFKNVFTSKDTLICGTRYETKLKGKSENIILPDDITISGLNDLTILSSHKPGKYLIRYVEKSQNCIVRDSMYITFKNSSLSDVSVSNSVLCPGEDLIITIRNNEFAPKWNLSDYNVSKISVNNYLIKDLKQGRNTVKFDISDGDCLYNYEKDIEVLNTIRYKCISTPSVCSKSNATLTVVSGNGTPSEYSLNNSYSNNTGIFTNLDPGIYSLSIKYGDGCRIYDTLLIRDSFNISPYFIADRDLVNKNKYSFQNLTKVDDKGYERNNSIKFIWKVNGEEIIEADNPEYEFTKNGNNTVELIAILDESCQSIYSETINVAISNFRIPNIFTPNGDGIGDEFRVFYDGKIKSYSLTIMSRMGEIAFESNNIAESWDGKINGNDEAAEGLYYYIIRGEDEFGKVIEQKGALQLVRH